MRVRAAAKFVLHDQIRNCHLFSMATGPAAGPPCRDRGSGIVSGMLLLVPYGTNRRQMTSDQRHQSMRRPGGQPGQCAFIGMPCDGFNG
jgi:hypothetical protein